MSKIGKFIKSKKAEIIRLLISLGLLLISALIGIFLALKETNGLNRYVNEAYEYYRDNNWMALYNYADMSDDDFINEYFFEVMAASMYGEIDKSLLTLGEVEDDGDKATAKLIYKGAGSDDAAWVMNFKKTSESRYIFFKRWKLDIDAYILRGCTVTVPAGCDVYVDGVELTAENSAKETDSENGTDTYTIPKIFKGIHTVNVTGDILDVTDEQVTWNEDNGSYTLAEDSLVISPSDKDELVENAQTIVQSMYTAVFGGQGTESLIAYFAQNEEVKSKLQSVYDSIFAAITPEDGSTLNSISITSFTESGVSPDYPSGADVTLNFECTFSARGPRNTGGGVRDKYDGTATSTVTFHFVKEGESWLCDDLNMQCIDYSKQPEESQ